MKPGDKDIFPTRQNDISPLTGQKGDHTMMQHGMQPGMEQKDMYMMAVLEKLTEEQKKTLMKRMLDSKIMMKEGMIKHLQFELETKKMIRAML